MTESEIKGRKRVTWDKTETASLIDLVFKNPAIWNIKSKVYMDTCKKGAGLWPQIASPRKNCVSASDPQHPSLLNCMAMNKNSRTKIDIQQLSLR